MWQKPRNHTLHPKTNHLRETDHIRSTLKHSNVQQEKNGENWSDRLCKKWGKNYIGSRIKSLKANWVGRNLSRNFLLKHFFKEIYKGKEDEKDDVGSYCMIATQREDIGNWNRIHLTALSGELISVDGMDLSFRDSTWWRRTAVVWGASGGKKSHFDHSKTLTRYQRLRIEVARFAPTLNKLPCDNWLRKQSGNFTLLVENIPTHTPRSDLVAKPTRPGRDMRASR
jgi:hypothetical protein